MKIVQNAVGHGHKDICIPLFVCHYLYTKFIVFLKSDSVKCIKQGDFERNLGMFDCAM